jgi:hypothetical protein
MEQGIMISAIINFVNFQKRKPIQLVSLDPLGVNILIDFFKPLENIHSILKS